MKKYVHALLLALMVTGTAHGSGMIDDPLLAMVLVDQFELRVLDGETPLVWDAEGWVGYDLNKLWIKTDGEYLDGQFEEAELQALYSRAIATYWDVQIGWRGDLEPTPTRNWLALSLKGLAPYFFDIDAGVFVGESGHTAARLKIDYEFLFTQKIILVPEIELNLYGKDDPSTGIGSGLSDIEAGLRLRYEIRREFAPYIGVNWIHFFGDTADYALMEDNDTDNFQFVFGIRAWF